MPRKRFCHGPHIKRSIYDSDQQREIVFANPTAGERPRAIFWFTTGGFAAPIYVVAWGTGFEDALEEAVDWIIEHAPGVLDDEYVEEERTRLIAEKRAEGADLEDEAVQEEINEEAEMDMTLFGHSGLHYISSENWGIQKENPSRADILALQGRLRERRAPGRDALAERVPGHLGYVAARRRAGHRY